jgi:hypothetical protein
MFVFQPPNSPHCNVKDTCIFPSLSKIVTWEQASTNGSNVLEGEQLNICVSNAWEKLKEETISRAYLHNHQIACAIARDHGGDDFVKEAGGGGLHCGVSKHAIPYYKNDNNVPSGVYVAEEQCEDLLNSMQNSTWKYDVPDVNEYNPSEYLNESEKYFFLENLPNSDPMWENIAVDLFIGNYADKILE